MNDLLNNPAVQAAAVPFAVALVLALLLARTRFLAAAVASGMVVMLSLTIGFSLEPLTSVRKMIVVVLGVSAGALALEAMRLELRKPVAAAVAIVCALPVVWILLRILEQKEVASAWMAGAGAVAYVLAMVGGALATSTNPVRAAVVGMCLGWGAGALAVLGASALLGQIGIAIGTACAAVALVQMLLGRRAPLGWTLAVPAAAGAALVAVLASATGETRWYRLLPLLLCAPAALLVPAEQRKPWQQAFLFGFAALVPVVLAIGWAIWSARSLATAG